MSDARSCPYCGEPLLDSGHTGCVGLFRDVMRASAEGELPAEAAPFARNPHRQVRDYVLVEEIGRGGMGTVWKAWDRKLQRWAALKFLHGEQDAARLEREARLAARLRHPNIAAIYEVGEAASRTYLAMELVDGKPLGSDPLPAPAVAEILLKVARAVEAAHRAGVVHRDLKPQNILVTRERWPYVMDFGLAKAIRADRSLSASGAVLGTPAYMPPEQAQGRLQDVDERSDVYALGSTLYAALCGAPPFEGETPLAVLAQVSEKPPVPLCERNPEVPPALETVVLKALSKKKEDRYPTAAAMAEDLERFLADQPVLARVPRRRHGGLAAAFLAVAAAIVAAAVALRPDPPKGPPPLLRPATDEDRRDVEERLQRFRLALELATSEQQILRMSEVDFATGFTLPEAHAGDPAALVWARSVSSILSRIRLKEASGADLLAAAASAAPLEPQGRNAWFQAVESMAFESLKERLAAESARARDARAPEREECRRRAEALVGRWKAFLDGLDGGFRRRHGVLEDHDRELARQAADFPSDLKELAQVDLFACLRAANPEAELEQAVRFLRGLESREGITVESRQSLLTAIVNAAAHRALLAGRTPQEAAESLRGYAARLRHVGGAADVSAFSPAVREVFDLLLR